jgi:hypothetical protein
MDAWIILIQRRRLNKLENEMHRKIFGCKGDKIKDCRTLEN